jgi:hypothetical protein
VIEEEEDEVREFGFKLSKLSFRSWPRRWSTRSGPWRTSLLKVTFHLRILSQVWIKVK